MLTAFDEQINKTLESKPDKPQMTEAERQQALALLKSPDLLDRILGS